MSEMKRFRATVSAEQRRRLGFDLHSQVCVLASSADALLSAKDVEIADLRLKLGEAQRDAERYRWLRDVADVGDAAWLEYSAIDKNTGRDVDDIIDAAKAK